MARFPDNPELSIIVPVLNEAEVIMGLLRNLAEQKGMDFEVVVCDGGSSDGTADKMMEAAGGCFFPTRIVTCEKGRGRQMNKGAAAAKGVFLLFLHADSLFRDAGALRKAVDALVSAGESVGHDRVAGRFALRFRLQRETAPLFFYFHESKARLDRGECIHGDQGFLLARSFFLSAGPFDESVPVLEDTLFAERVRKAGKWILFPDEIFTSARRFEIEGRVERETLNALIMALFAAGRTDFLNEIPRIYSARDRTRRLRLFPFLNRIRELAGELPIRERMSFWVSCGAYALENSWQLAFVLDARDNFRDGEPPGGGRFRRLEHFDRRICHATRAAGLKPLAALFVWFWFHATLVRRYMQGKK